MTFQRTPEYEQRVEDAIEEAKDWLSMMFDAYPADAAQVETTDPFYVHDEDGRPLARESVPTEAMSNSLFKFKFNAEGEWVAVGINAEMRDVVLDRAKRGDAEADRQLRAAAAYALERLWRPGDPLAAHAAEALRKSIEADPTRRRHLKSAAYIVGVDSAVQMVAFKYGFAPTRNAAAHGKDDAAESACSIVLKALARLGKRNRNEAAIEKMWQRSGLRGG